MSDATGGASHIARSHGTRHSFPVRYEPGMRLLRLAILLAGSRAGLTLDEMAEQLGTGRRTVERLRDRLEEVFPGLSYIEDESRTRRWRLPSNQLPPTPPNKAAIATLESLATELATRGDAARSTDLRDAAASLRATMRPQLLSRAEPDIEALMKAEGSAAQPGPRLKLDTGLISDIRRAILAFQKLSVRYRPADAEREGRRVLCPYAVLYGRRTYLVAHTDKTTEMGLWRIDRISDLAVLEDQFSPQPFDLAAFSERSFGVFQEPPQDVVLRFLPDAAEDAADWLFHPSQTIELQQDGSVIVRFRCGGMRELAWHLFTWGHGVRVIEPDELRFYLPAYFFKDHEREKTQVFGFNRRRNAGRGNPPRKPWEGRQFKKDRNLLIVGESFYGFQEDPNDPDIGISVVKDVINGKRLPFFTKIESAIRGCDALQTNPADFWRTVAFVNFYQGAFPSAGNKDPATTREMLVRGIEVFPQILSQLKPKRMLVFSKHVWDNFDKFESLNWRSEAGIEREGKSIDNGYLTARDKSCHVYCTWLPHPASRNWGAPTRWTPFIKEFMDRRLG